MQQRKNEDLGESIRFIRSKTAIRPSVGIILGSGLGELAETLSTRTAIPTSSIPHYPKSTVVGHRGALIFGRLTKVSVLAFQGRVHFYESGNLESVLYPIRVAWSLGVKKLIVTNAAGGVNPRFAPGDLMLITDHINLTFENSVPGIGGSKFHQPPYDEALNKLILRVAKKNHINLQRGVYCGMKGPSYETAAEIEMARRIGGDAVGMSTVNEVSLASRLGMRVAGISCITNLATGISEGKLSHDEVTEVANRVKQTFAQLLRAVISALR